MIFAAGFGTRMGALTNTRPKPMISLAGRPMIDHAIELVRDAGVEQIVANTHYLSEVIEPHLTGRGVRLSTEQPDILDTGGGLKAALPLLGNDVVITLNPDVVWLGPNPIRQLIEAWRPSMQALLMVVPLDRVTPARESGDFSLEHGAIRRNGDFLYTGAQIIRTNKLNDIEESVFSLNRYWDSLANDTALNGLAYDGRWCDIGTPEGLSSAERLLSHG